MGVEAAALDAVVLLDLLAAGAFFLAALLVCAGRLRFLVVAAVERLDPIRILPSITKRRNCRSALRDDVFVVMCCIGGIKVPIVVNESSNNTH